MPLEFLTRCESVRTQTDQSARPRNLDVDKLSMTCGQLFAGGSQSDRSDLAMIVTKPVITDIYRFDNFSVTSFPPCLTSIILSQHDIHNAVMTIENLLVNKSRRRY